MTTNLPAAASTQTIAKKPAIVQFIEDRRFQIGEMLPKHLPLERFLRLVYTEMRKNPDLMACTPESVVGGMLTGSALGLEIGGALGEAYLIPYNVKYYDREERRDKKRLEAEFVQGYKGLAKLFWQHPMSARLSAEYVCEQDEFSYDKGLKPFLHHVPATGDRGRVVAYYAIVGLQGRDAFFDVFTPEQIKKIRGGKVGSKGDIKDPERWMERKTALIQVLKLAPKSTSLVSALAVDERSGADLWNAKAASAINTGMGLPELPHLVMDDDGYQVDSRTGELVDATVTQELAPVPPAGAVKLDTGEGTSPASAVSGREASTIPPVDASPTPKTRPATGANTAGGTPAAVAGSGEAAAGDGPAAASAPLIQQHHDDEPADEEPVDETVQPLVDTRPGPIRASQKTRLRAECIRLGIQSVLAEKLMWFDLILGTEEPLTAIDQLDVRQADRLVEFLAGVEDRPALEAWGAGQNALLDGQGE